MKISLKRRQDKSGPETMGLVPVQHDGPTVYLSEIEGLEGLKNGDEVTLKGEVISVTTIDRNGKKSTSVDIALSDMDRPGEAGTKTAFKKEKPAQKDMNEIEDGLKKIELQEGGGGKV